MKLPRALLAALAALAVASCGATGGDPLSDGIAAYEARDYNAARVALANAIGDEQTRTPEAFDYYARTLLALEDGDGPPEMLGDIALALEVCAKEADDKSIALADHAAHLLIHGLLHLAGHDHVDTDAQAEAMEKLEIEALALMGIADPYGDRNFQE